MKIKIKAFGAARKQIPDYDKKSGIEMELPAGSTIKDLLGHLHIPTDKGLAVFIDGLIAGQDVKIKDGATIVFLNPLSGG